MQNNQEDLALQEDQQEEQINEPAAESAQESTEDNSDQTNVAADNSVAEAKPAKETYRKKDYKDMYEKSLKSYENLRQLQDRRYNETQKIVESLKKELNEVAPYKELLKRASDAQKQAELTELAQTNPAEYQRRLIELAKQELSQQIAPVQQQQEMMQGEQYVTQAINYLQNTYGQEIYTGMVPYMQNILAEASSASPENARILAQHPDALMQMAIGQAYLEKVREHHAQQAQNKQTAVQNQQKAVKFAAGSATPQSSGRKTQSYDTMSDEQLRELAYAELAKKYNS